MVKAMDGSSTLALLYPLSREVVLDVAAALKVGGFRSARSYMLEPKMGHVEAGHAVGDSLARTPKVPCHGVRDGKQPSKLLEYARWLGILRGG